MAARVTGEQVARWALRLLGRGSPWHQCGPQTLTGIPPSSSSTFSSSCSSSGPSPPAWSARRRPAAPPPPPPPPPPLASVRFCSRSLSEGPKEDRQRPSGQQQRPSRPLNPRPPNPFYEKLQACVAPADVLDLASRSNPRLRQVSNCLMHLWEMMKRLSPDQRRYELRLLFEHPGMEDLLQLALQDALRMRHEDVAYSLLAAVKLGVAQQSRVVQTLLRTCQDNINNMNEKSLSVVATALEIMDDSPNVSALKQGMRLAVDVRLPSIRNVMALQTMMRMLGSDAPPDLKKKLERKALSMADGFSPANSQYMVTTMASMKFHSKPLLEVCGKKMAENILGIPFPRLLKVLRSYRDLRYRDLELFTVISDYMASSMDVWSDKQVVLTLAAFEELSFCPHALMDAFAQRVIRDPDSLIYRDVLSVLKSYSSLNHDLQDHRQQFLDGLVGVLGSYLPRALAHEVLQAVYSLCLLGHFPPGPLELLLDPAALEDLSNADSRHVRQQEKKLQTVDLCLRLDRPALPRPLSVPASALGAPVPRDPLDPQLSRTLRGVVEGVPGAALQEAVVMEDCYLIDGVITTTPPAETEGNAPSPAENSPRIAAISMNRFAVCYGTSRPRGHLAIKIRHLKALGYTPFLVMETEFESMSEEERIEVLRRRIFPDHQGSNAQPLAD